MLAPERSRRACSALRGQKRNKPNQNFAYVTEEPSDYQFAPLVNQYVYSGYRRKALTQNRNHFVLDRKKESFLQSHQHLKTPSEMKNGELKIEKIHLSNKKDFVSKNLLYRKRIEKLNKIQIVSK